MFANDSDFVKRVLGAPHGGASAPLDLGEQERTAKRISNEKQLKCADLLDLSPRPIRDGNGYPIK